MGEIKIKNKETLQQTAQLMYNPLDIKKDGIMR